MNRPIIGRLLLVLALLLALGGGGVWLATGAHRGWSMNSVPKKQTDEITGIIYSVDEDRFVAGVDFLGAALLGAGALAGGSLFFRKTKTNNT